MAFQGCVQGSALDQALDQAPVRHELTTVVTWVCYCWNCSHCQSVRMLGIRRHTIDGIHGQDITSQHNTNKAYLVFC